MSYGRPTGGGYGDSFRTAQPTNRYEDAYSAPGATEARRARRAAAFNGTTQPSPSHTNNAGNNSNNELSPRDPYSAPSVPAWRRGDRPAEQHMNNAPSAAEDRVHTSGPAVRSMEGVVQHIQEKWNVLVADDCVPVHIALQLMDYSSLGRGNDYDDFRRTSQALQRALRAIVNENHQGFNSSIGTFHKIQSSIQTSQERVRTLKIALDEARLNLMMVKPELRGISMASQNFDQMLLNIGQIEKIQTLPEQLDAAISDKHFLTAVDILQDGLQLISKSELEEVGALIDLRNYLSNQETSLTDILLEELHDHLYLKSPYCQSRWKPYASPTSDSSADLSKAATGVRPLYRFLTGLNVLTPMVDDATRNPEQDNFEYIHMIIEALNKMGRLEVAVDRIDQRLPVELFAVMEKTNQEVDARHPAHLRMVGSGGKGSSYSAKLGVTPSTEAILNDLLYTLYSKFEAIAEGHRVIQEVIEGIIARENLKRTSNLTRGFKELWKLLQSEMRSLLHDYLATDSSGTMYNTKDAANLASNIFQKNPRDRQKQVFKLNELNLKSTQLVAEQEELDKILQRSVPGLVEKSQRRSMVNTSDRRVTYETRTQGHKVLVEPNPFHINLLLTPSLSFLQRLKDIVPPDSDIAISTLTSFLDDFLINVFNPQLDETIAELCLQVFNDPAAYYQDAGHSKLPVFKSAAQFLTLIKSFCKIINSIPQDQSLSRLIVTQLEAYYKQCNSWYSSMVTRVEDADGKARLKWAAAKMDQSDLAGITTSLWESEDAGETARLIQAEISQITRPEEEENSFDALDMISDRRTGTAFCLLYSTLQWLCFKLTQLRVLEKSPQERSRGQQQQHSSQRSNRWGMLSTAALRDDDQPVHLTMTEDTISSFDNVIALFQQLSTRALLTLHLDIRYGINYMLTQAFTSSTLLSHPTHEPDSTILSLNAALVSFTETMKTYLAPREHTFMTAGLARLIDTAIASNATSHIKQMNTHGCNKWQLNILVLQQNLKSIEPKDSLLRHSVLFFESFLAGPRAIVALAKGYGQGQKSSSALTNSISNLRQQNTSTADEANSNANGDPSRQANGRAPTDAFTTTTTTPLSEDEIKALLELSYSEALASPHRDVAAQAKRNLQADLLAVTESMWSQ